MNQAQPLDMPTPPEGYHWEIKPAELWDTDLIFWVPLPTSLTVWLAKGSYDTPGSAAAFARPNPASIRRAARRALRGHYRFQRWSARRDLVKQQRANRAAKWTGTF